MAKTSGRVIVVSGGTGALGCAVVSAFLDAGDRVVVPWIVEAEAQAMPEHERLLLVEADVAEAAGAESVVKSAGGASVLVNGVGGFAGGDAVHETDLDTWDRLYRIRDVREKLDENFAQIWRNFPNPYFFHKICHDFGRFVEIFSAQWIRPELKRFLFYEIIFYRSFIAPL